MAKFRTFRTEIDPTEEQKQKIRQAMGVSRVVYNLYISENQARYQAEVEKAKAEKRKPKSTLMYPSVFYSWLKKEYIPETGKTWINDCSAKSVRQAINNAYEAYQRFFKHLSKFPKFKKRGRGHNSVYFCRNSLSQPVISERHFIQIPKLGRVHLKEKGYIPSCQKGKVEIKKGSYTEENGRFYVSVLVEYTDLPKVDVSFLKEEGLGIDVGLKELMVLSDGTFYPNINRKRPVKRKSRKKKHLQRIFSRKLRSFKKRKKEFEERTDRKEGEVLTCSNLNRARKKVSSVQRKLNYIREAWRRQCVADVMKKNPSFIVMENLNVRGMMKNKKLARAISEVQWYRLRTDIQFACAKRKIEFRLAERTYPSSKTCHHCGHVLKDLKLSDRTYVCPECGHEEDRDLNAAMNLRDTSCFRTVSLETEMI